MDEHLYNHRRSLIRTVSTALQKNGFETQQLESADEVLDAISSLIPEGASIGYGGSQTLKRLRVMETLRDMGKKVMYQDPSQSREEIIKIRRDSLHADVFVGSPNALTIDGKLMFVDKIGNRTNGMTFGPTKVIAVAGYNKIVWDELAGWQRIKLFAAPPNALRLNINPPCANTGICSDCNSPQRMCGTKVVLEKKPAYTSYHVILVPEELGY